MDRAAQQREREPSRQKEESGRTRLSDRRKVSAAGKQRFQSPSWRKASFALHPPVDVVPRAGILQGMVSQRSRTPELDLKED